MQYTTCADKNGRMEAALTHLSKAFDCGNDLLIAKISAYGLNNYSFCYIYSYLKERKQSVQMNNK